MHPSLFKDIWGLSYPQLADVLPRSEETLKRYGYRASSKKRLIPSSDILFITQSIHQAWITEGRQPVRPWLIPQDANAARCSSKGFDEQRAAFPQRVADLGAAF